MRPIQVLTVRELEDLVRDWSPARKIDSIHIHCTDRPRHEDFRGLATIEAMRSYHRSIGMSDIAQHLTADPNGLLWTGRAFDVMPASVRGHNGSSAQGPFMIEMVGLFEDRGGVAADPFGGDQKAAVQAVVCAILRKFGLDETAVKFHREFPKTGKTCPGAKLDPKIFRSEIKAAVKDGSLHNFDSTLPRGLERSALDRDAVLSQVSVETPGYLEVPEDKAALDEQAMLASWFERGLFDPTTMGASRGADEEYQELLPHVINTSQGILSTKGKLNTTSVDIQNLIERHLTPAFDGGGFQHLLFYAHGGLNSEKGSLDYAKVMAPWWRSYGVYPIFFVWESSLFQTIFQQPREARRASGRGFGDFVDGVTEAATQKLARPIWSRMKANARRCSAATTEFGRPGGLHEFWTALEGWLAARKDRVALHAMGHSTGPILLSSFMPLVIGNAGSAAQHTFKSLNYLAPAIRIDDFARDVQPLVGRSIERLRVFTMDDDAERDDNVAKLYRKSLLYYVREACEDLTQGRLVGLERDLYADSGMRRLFGLRAAAGDPRAPVPANPNAAASIEFSPGQNEPANPFTRATAHGGFDNDEATMTTALARMLGRPNLVGLVGGRRFPTAEDFKRGEALDDVSERAVDDAFEVGGGCPCCCCARPDERPVGQDPFNAGDDSGSIEPSEPAPSRPASGGSGGSGRKIAVCVGINAYPRQPLDGCVRDSENWAKALSGIGFEIRTLRDKEATRAALHSTLRGLIREGRAGDHLVFQFAGHGAQVEDLSGDEQDGFDEVVVPVDFDSGALWIDDDLYELSSELRSGVRLTFFMDCCHSGTNARFAPRLPARAAAKARFLSLNEKDVSAYKRNRRGGRALPPISERKPLPGVVKFAACRDQELAMEEQGQGNFSRHSLAVFERILDNRGTNRDFLAAVERQFGADQRQHPMLDQVADNLERASFLTGR